LFGGLSATASIFIEFLALKKETPFDVMYNTAEQAPSIILFRFISSLPGEKTGGKRTHADRRPSESCVSGFKMRIESILSPRNPDPEKLSAYE